jgi:hypothetical protein
MDYGLSTAYETANNHSINTGGDYHQFHSHYQHHNIPYSNGFHTSSKFNGHDQLDGNEDEPPQQQQEQQTADNDYELNDTDRPKLLMWGLTK